MALQFNPYPIGPWEERQRREQGPSFQDSVMDPINQGLGTLVDNQRIQLAQKRQAMMDEYLQQEQARKQQEHNYQFGIPIDPNVSVGVPTGTGQSSFMPGNVPRGSMGPNRPQPVGQGSSLIEQFNQYRASNYPKDQARPEFMQAMGAKEREMVFERDNPKPASIFMSPYQTASIDLKTQEVEMKRREAEAKRREADAASQQAQKDQAEKARTISQKIDDALNMVGATTAGFGGSLMGKVPGSGATDLQGVLDTIKANLGFDQLMTLKSGSKNGSSGLGALSENEMRLLTSLVESLDRSQSPQQLAQNLTNLKNKYSEFQNALGYNGTCGGAGGKIRVRNRQTGQTGSISEKFFDPNKYERVQ